MGLLDGIEGLLSNPAVQQLLPVVAGAAGSALTTPRGSGVRTQIGRALLGGAQGYEEGQKSQQEGLQTQKLQLEVAKMKSVADNQKALAKMLPTWEKDIPEDQRPVWRAQMTSGTPEGVQAGTAMRTAYLGQDQIHARMKQLVPGVTDAYLKTQNPVELGGIISKLETEKSPVMQRVHDSYVSAHADDAKKNPEQTDLEGWKVASKLEAQSKTDAAVQVFNAELPARKDLAKIAHPDKPEPLRPFYDRALDKNVEATPSEAKARGLEPPHKEATPKADEPTRTEVEKLAQAAGAEATKGMKAGMLESEKTFEARKNAAFQDAYDKEKAKFGGPVALPAGWKWEDKAKGIAIDDKGKRQRHVPD